MNQDDRDIREISSQGKIHWTSTENCLLSLVEPTPWLVDKQDIATIRPLGDEDWDELPRVMASAFGGQSPFLVSSTDDERVSVAGTLIRETRRHHFGRLIAPACFVAVERGGTGIVGAVLLNHCTYTQTSGFRWCAGEEFVPWDPGVTDPPPPMAHLTWAFVADGFAGRGVGTALLAHATEALRGLGYQDVASTFPKANSSSVLFHWRNGFRLLSRRS